LGGENLRAITVVLALVVVLVVAVAGCSSPVKPPVNQVETPAQTATPATTQSPALEKENFSEAIWKKCGEIEEALWNIVGATGGVNNTPKVVVIYDENSSGIVEAVKEAVNGSGYDIVAYNYSELNETFKNALQYVLARYGLPDELPVIAAVKPPVVFISVGGNTPLPDRYLLWNLEKYHPAEFFTGGGKAVAFVLHDPMYINETLDVAKKLDSAGVRVAIYYRTEAYGFASAKVLNDALESLGFDVKEDYAVITKDGALEKVLPIEKAIKELNAAAAMTKPTQNETVNGSAKVTVYFVYSPSCPHCENVLPYVKEVAANYTANDSVGFVFCDVSNLNDKCKAIIDEYRVGWVPTAIVKSGSTTRMLVGEDQIKLLGDFLDALTH